jgi:hypothetical protein
LVNYLCLQVVHFGGCDLGFLEVALVDAFIFLGYGFVVFYVLLVTSYCGVIGDVIDYGVFEDRF